MTVLTTPRLRLVPISLEDAPFIQAEFPHWNIVRFMNPLIPWPYPADGAVTFLRDILLPKIADGTDYGWTIRRRDQADARIGVITVDTGQSGENRGFWIARAHQRQGFAGEAAEAVTDFYFDVLGQQELRVSKAVDNIASGRISAREGMRVVWQGEKAYVGGRMPAEIWAISRDEWRGR